MNLKSFKKIVFVEVVFLVIQFLLGMYINIFVSGPPYNTLANLLFASHVAVGTIILAIAAYLSIRVRKIGDNAVRKPSIAGLVFVVIAYLGGLSFVFTNGNDTFSYVMAIAFLFAIIAYVFLAGILSVQRTDKELV